MPRSQPDNDTSANSGKIILRPFAAGDRSAVRAIACDTALMGEPCERFFDGREAVADALSAYYTDYEPQSCFVAESEGRVSGYLLGSLDVKKARNIFSRKIAPGLWARALGQGIFFKRKNIRFLARVGWSAWQGEFRDPSFTEDYPAELHINLAAGFRGRGIGGRLIAMYLDYLRRQRVAGLHFGSFSDDASVFFQKQGFEVLYRAKRSYFRHVLGRDVNLYILGKKLEKA